MLLSNIATYLIVKKAFLKSHLKKRKNIANLSIRLNKRYIESLKKEEEKRRYKLEEEQRLKDRIQREHNEKLDVWNRIIERVLPDFENVVKSMKEGEQGAEEFRAIWVRGIPEKVRAKVWARVTGNNNSLTESLFEIMAMRGNRLRKIIEERIEVMSESERLDYEIEVENKKVKDLENKSLLEEGAEEDIKEGDEDRDKVRNGVEDLKKEKSKYDTRLRELSRDVALIMGDSKNSREESIKIIANDIPRTFSKEHAFKSEVYAETLQKVLEAFAVYRPDIGYVQGMSYI